MKIKEIRQLPYMSNVEACGLSSHEPKLNLKPNACYI